MSQIQTKTTNEEINTSTVDRLEIPDIIHNTRTPKIIQGLKDSKIRNRILFTLLVVIIYRLGSLILIPNIDRVALLNIESETFFNVFNMVSGSTIQQFSIFSLGVSPYITASIIIQMLQMDISPTITEWSKQGEYGRKKIKTLTLISSGIIGTIQSFTLIKSFDSLSESGILLNNSNQTLLLTILLMVSGTVFLSWLGEKITDKGIGQGLSIIIFAGIISKLPNTLLSLINNYYILPTGNELKTNIYYGIGISVILLIVLYLIIFVERGERQLPIRYTNQISSETESYLPIKLNNAGVMPIIFASSILSLPSLVVNMFRLESNNEIIKVILGIFDLETWQGIVFYTTLVIIFTFFYSFVQMNPEKIAENLQSQGGYILNIRPGNDTVKYLNKILFRLAIFGSIFLAFISVSPMILQKVFNLDSSIGMGGTSVLIVIGVGIETVKQLEGLLLKFKYQGLLNNTFKSTKK